MVTLLLTNFFRHKEEKFPIQREMILEKYLEQRNKAKFAADMIDLW